MGNGVEWPVEWITLRVPLGIAARVEAYAREQGLGWDEAALELIRLCLRAVSRATILPSSDRRDCP